MKHCQQMAAARQKAQEAQQAARNKMDAMFQEVRAALDTASKSKGDKKVAALQTAFEKLVAYHDAMHPQVSAMGEPHPMGMGSCCPGMEEHAMGGGCCGMASMKECPMMRGAAPAHH
jgi:hypothetical protein